MRTTLLSGKMEKVVVAMTLLCFAASANLVLPRRSWAMSLSEENELGRKLLEKIREQLPLIEDGEIVTYVQSVGNRIVKQVGTTPYRYQFFVIDESVPNAFAIPGGYIFVNRGLIELMSSEGELAGILSHEIAHIQARHFQRRLEEGRILSVASLAGVVAGILLGMGGAGQGAQALAMGSVAGAESFQLKYSRENEEEADQLGFRYLCDAGYPPKDMVSIMQKMSQGKWRTGSSKIPAYLSTHPALSERVLYLQDLVRKQANRPAAKTCASGDFPLMQAALIAGYAAPELATDRFRAGVKANDTAAVFGMGRLELRQGMTKDALPLLQQAARQESCSPLVLSALGSAYVQMGRMDEAQKVLQSALVLDPASTIAHLRLASVLQERGQKDEALQHLRQIEDFAPLLPEIDYNLGVLLGQMNQLGLAHYHLGRFYANKQDWSLAFFHYTKSKALLKDSPQKLQEVTEALKEIEKRKKESGRDSHKK